MISFLVVVIFLISLTPAFIVTYLYYRNYKQLPEAPGKQKAIKYALISCVPLYIVGVKFLPLFYSKFFGSAPPADNPIVPSLLLILFVTLPAAFLYFRQVGKIKSASGDAASYIEELEAAVSDKKLDDEEIEHLKNLVEKYKLPTDVLKKIHKDVFISTLLNCVTDDFVISPSEKKLLTKMANTLEIDQEVVDYADQIMEQSKTIKRIIGGKEEGITTSDFIPQKNEDCLLLEDCTLYENVKKGFYVGTSVGLKEIIPLGKLFNPRLYLGKQVNYQQLEKVDNGKIALTTKRIVFVGESITRAFKLGDIIGLDIGPDCFQVNRQGKAKKEVFHMSPDVTQIFIGALNLVIR